MNLDKGHICDRWYRSRFQSAFSYVPPRRLLGYTSNRQGKALERLRARRHTGLHTARRSPTHGLDVACNRPTRVRGSLLGGLTSSLTPSISVPRARTNSALYTAGVQLDAQRRTCRAEASRSPQPYSSGPQSSAPVSSSGQAPAFRSLERQITDNLATQQPGLGDGWTEVAGTWVLRPPNSRPPKAIVLFIGGAFVGAAPQLSYRALLEALAARDRLIIAAPFSTSFDHGQIADELNFKLDNAMRSLPSSLASLPVFGLGHSMGSLLHLLISCRYPAQRAGNVLMSFNNKDVLEAIPFFSPFIAPGARALGPILSQIATSPFRSQVEAPLEMLRGLSPGLVQQFFPILDQLLPIYMDVSNGRQEFRPTPQEAQQMIRSNYGVTRNMLLQFESDKIDESERLAQILTSGSAVSAQLELTAKVLPGDHIQPLLLNPSTLPPELAAALSQGNQFLEQFSNAASQASNSVGGPFQDLARNLTGLTGSIAGGQDGAAQVAAIEMLADSIDEWLLSQPSVHPSKTLPAPSGSTAPQ